MTLIREDIYGEYAIVDGYIARPAKTTQYKVGDKTEGRHVGSSFLIGIGKAEGRGKYKEYWRISGYADEHRQGIIETIQMFRGW